MPPPPSKKVVLVTGATGFVGGHLARRLGAEGFTVRILKRGSGPLVDDLADELKNAQDAGARLDVRTGDIMDRASLSAAVQGGVDVVFHLAGLIAHSGAQREAMRAVNVEGTRNVIEASVAAGVRRLVNMSSIAAVGASRTPDFLLTENSANPTANRPSAYGDT
jgi:dihydroflavonol-4-reductase